MKNVHRNPQVSAGHGERLSRKGEDALAALLKSPTIRTAAEACGLNEKTLRRWLRDPDFKTRYAEMRRECLDDACRVLAKSASAASVSLVKLLTDPATPTTMKFATASRILELAMRAHELFDFEQRLEALEAAQQMQGVP